MFPTILDDAIKDLDEALFRHRTRKGGHRCATKGCVCEDYADRRRELAEMRQDIHIWNHMSEKELREIELSTKNLDKK